MQDHSNAMGRERDRCKDTLRKLMEMVLAAEDPATIKEFADTEVRQLVS